MAKLKRKKRRSRSRGLGEIKRKAHKVSKFASSRAGRQVRRMAVAIEVVRYSRGIGGAHEGQYLANACISTRAPGPAASKRRRALPLGYANRCADGIGKTPTRATAAALKELAKDLK